MSENGSPEDLERALGRLRPEFSLEDSASLAGQVRAVVRRRRQRRIAFAVASGIAFIGIAANTLGGTLAPWNRSSLSSEALSSIAHVVNGGLAEGVESLAPSTAPYGPSTSNYSGTGGATSPLTRGEFARLLQESGDEATHLLVPVPSQAAKCSAKASLVSINGTVATVVSDGQEVSETLNLFAFVPGMNRLAVVYKCESEELLVSAVRTPTAGQVQFHTEVVPSMVIAQRAVDWRINQWDEQALTTAMDLKLAAGRLYGVVYEFNGPASLAALCPSSKGRGVCMVSTAEGKSRLFWQIDRQAAFEVLVPTALPIDEVSMQLSQAFPSHTN